jgi:hypothetical protein
MIKVSGWRRGGITDISIPVRYGHRLSIFYNKKNNLLVIDKTKGMRGNEFVRTKLSKIQVPTRRDLMKYREVV